MERYTNINASLVADKFANNPHNQNVAESQLAAQIIALLEHYKQKDPVGLPNAPVSI